MRKLIFQLFVVMAVFASTVSAADFGVDNVWYNGSIPGWSVSPVDPCNSETFEVEASGPESFFAIQDNAGSTELVGITWNAGQSKWLKEVIDTNDYISIADNIKTRDSLFAIQDDGSGTGPLYAVAWEPVVGWRTILLDDTEAWVTLAKNPRLPDPNYEQCWGARVGSLWQVTWTAWGGWDLGVANWINQFDYQALVANNYPDPCEADPNFYDVVFGARVGGGLDAVGYSPGSGWTTGQIVTETGLEFVSLAADKPDSVWAIDANGLLHNYYWSSGLGYWVHNTMGTPGKLYLDVVADAPDSVYAARADGSLENIWWNSDHWEVSTISTKYYTDLSSAWNINNSVFGAVGDLEPTCGDYLHPSPSDKDFNGDCIVDCKDFAEFAADWLLDNQP